MRDWEIKNRLRETLIADILQADPGSLVVEEMEVCSGDARVDLGVINGKITGYEIKSSLDDLRRLPNQVNLYSRVLDSVSVVIDAKHLTKIKEQIPDWWGIILVLDDKFDVIRESKDNPVIDAMSVAALLWRDEALSILAAHGLDRGVRSKMREVLWHRLASSMPIQDLKKEVRNKLKARLSWRGDPPQKSDDALFPLFST